MRTLAPFATRWTTGWPLQSIKYCKPRLEVAQIFLIITPEDSVSCIGSQAQSNSSKRSKNHSRVSSHGSLAAPVEAARIKEAAKFAELKVEKVMLERRKVLEEKKFRLKQEEARLNLEVEIAEGLSLHNNRLQKC